jgi:Ca2+-transporting ATPase
LTFPLLPKELSLTRWHALTSDAVASEFQSDLTHGLSVAEAQRRLRASGPNVLPEAARPSALALFLRQFTSIIVWVLIAAALVSGLLHEWLDAGAIVAIVVLNAILGFVQEFRAERSLAALKQLSLTTARVLREGRLSTMPAAALVPGDLVEIEAGDHVPADARLVYAANLQTQESALTGESTPVEKMTAALSNADAPLADRSNLIFLGTTVTTGKGRALVIATGTATELGRIATLMQEVETEPTPLQRRLEQFGHLLLVFA